MSPSNFTILGLCGSLRPGSHTLKALEMVLEAAQGPGVETRKLYGDPMRLALCDGRHPDEAPSEVAAFLRTVAEARAVVLATPDYCGSFSGVLKNALDWLAPAGLAGKVAGLVSVAGGPSAEGSLLALRGALPAAGRLGRPHSGCGAAVQRGIRQAGGAVRAFDGRAASRAGASAAGRRPAAGRLDRRHRRGEVSDLSDPPAADYDLLVDPRYGLIRSITPHPHGPEIPAALVSLTATVSNTQLLGPWNGDRAALGAAFFDSEPARRAAIGEAVERYCGNFIPRGLRKASYLDLAAAGETALHPEELVLYSESQYAAEGFPFVRLGPALSVYWAEARDLSSGQEILVPASLVYINFYVGRLAEEPLTNFVIYSGIAAGAGREAAERSALEELIERDATMIWWLSGSPVTELDAAGSPVVRAALAAREDDGALSYRLIQIPTVFEIPVVGALIQDRRNQIVALGVACRPEPTAAALKALVEAIHLRYFSLGLLDPRGSVWLSMEAGILDARPYKPFRADRAYMDSYRADFHDVTDLGCQSQIYLDPRMHRHVERILRPGASKPLGSVPRLEGGDPRRLLLDRLADHGFRALSADVTTPDVRAAGLSVVRVIVPGLYPNAPAAFPCLGGRRLYEEPARLGWLPGVLGEEDLDLTPLPHT